jgi:hypothetical protein
VRVDNRTLVLAVYFGLAVAVGLILTLIPPSSDASLVSLAVILAVGVVAMMLRRRYMPTQGRWLAWAYVAVFVVAWIASSFALRGSWSLGQ